MKLIFIEKPTLWLEASVRAANVMERAGLDTVGKLAHITDAELRALPNCGKLTVRELRSFVPYQPERQDFVYVDEHYGPGWWE